MTIKKKVNSMFRTLALKTYPDSGTVHDRVARFAYAEAMTNEKFDKLCIEARIKTRNGFYINLVKAIKVMDRDFRKYSKIEGVSIDYIKE